jgi:ribosomal protein S18 acetylase RimI-like enzyme
MRDADVMNIIATHTLSVPQFVDVERLEAAARRHEALQSRLFLSNRLNIETELPCFFLGYKRGRLVSVLCAFFPTAEEVEFSGYTHPDHRQKGYFTALVRHALTRYKPLNFTRALFPIESTSSSGAQYVAHRYPVIDHSEYVMSLQRTEWTAPVPEKGILERVNHYTGTAAAQVMATVFGGGIDRARERVVMMLDQSGRAVYLYRLHTLAVGVLNTQSEGRGMVKIYGVGILPQYRRHGHGKAMMALALSNLFTEAHTVTLEVDSTNADAIALYTGLGFIPTMQIDFHLFQPDHSKRG